MARSLSLAAILLWCVCAMAQPRLSPPSRAMLHELNSDRGVLAFVTHDDAACLDGLSVLMRYGDIALVAMSADRVDWLAQQPAVRAVELASRIRANTDSARADTHTDQVLQGIGLNTGYDGSGVLIGLIDTGIDFTHLAFRDRDGHRRIERVYCPTDTTGMPVVIDGVNFPGSQFVTDDEIGKLTTDDSLMTHGTHTLGIAGGSRVGPYSGMAPGARLVVVAIPSNSLTSASLLLGAQYIVHCARQMQLPCVISMSMGDHLGAHDGTSPLARGFDAIVDQGVVFVQSAGNEANSTLHLHKDFDPSNARSGSWVGTVMRTSSGKASAEVDAWSADDTPIALELQLYDTRDGDTRFVIPPITRDTVIVLDNDPVISQWAAGTIQVRCGVDPTNGRYRVYSVFNTTMANARDFWAHIYRCDTVASMDAWNVDTRSRFSQMGRYDWQPGDGDYSINDIATGHKTISVGSYSARSFYQTAAGATLYSNTDEGQIAASSSYGVLPDGRSLPLVAAPGVSVISSVSSFAAASTWCYDVADDDGKTYRWAAMSGTSMSTPCAAGIIALWLQACPTLTPEQVREIISETSRVDAFTQQNPVRWGAGKIDALAGLKMALSMRPATVACDTNGDGSVDIADVNIVINVMLGKVTDVAAVRADASGDGVVDIADVNQIINVMLGQNSDRSSRCNSQH